MVLVKPHVRIAWGGDLGDPALEVWTNSVNWAPTSDSPDAVPSDSDLVEWYQTCSDALKAWFAQAPNNANSQQGLEGLLPCSYIPSTVKLKWLKINWIEADGKYRGAGNTYFFEPVVSGVDGGFGYTNFAPWQSTTAITFKTSVSRGRGARGRIYPPCAVSKMSTGTPYQDDSSVVGMANAAATLLTAFNTLKKNPGGSPTYTGRCVVSSVGKGNLPPILTTIESVVVDKVADVQRRRVNRVPRRVGPARAVTV